MTPARAREVIRLQSQFPFWGNYRRFMTDAEIASMTWRFRRHPSGDITFGRLVHQIAEADQFQARPGFDESDAELARKRLAVWNQIEGARVGDWVLMLDRTERRFTYDWGSELQTTCKGPAAADASFYFYGSCMSFSGSLDRAIPRAGLVDTGELRNGSAWFFHHNQSGAHRGVYFTVPCRVFRQTA